MVCATVQCWTYWEEWSIFSCTMLVITVAVHTQGEPTDILLYFKWMHRYHIKFCGAILLVSTSVGHWMSITVESWTCKMSVNIWDSVQLTKRYNLLWIHNHYHSWTFLFFWIGYLQCPCNMKRDGQRTQMETRNISCTPLRQCLVSNIFMQDGARPHIGLCLQ